jgi:hypothetical protein
MTIQELINHLKRIIDDKNISSDTPVLFAQPPNPSGPEDVDFYSEMYGHIQKDAFDCNTGVTHPKALIL